MISIAAVAALPAAVVAIWLMLRSPLARRLVASPSDDRWHTTSTPLFGGIGIFVGLTAGIWIAVAVGALHPGKQLLGIFAGASLLFLAGLADDLHSMRPVLKLALQLAAAATVLLTGTTVEIVGNPVLATTIALVWLVGMTNAFNLLDNMDGLAASLATIAATFFAIAAAWKNPDRLVLVVSLALALACLGFLPFNLRPGRRALAFMGDSGSQVIGFTLAALGLAASYTAAASTVATLILPILVLAVPILDTTLVTIVRLLDGRPISQGGRDHTSHRLVYMGLSDTGAVVLLAAVSAALGATSLAYEVLGSGRIAAIGVLVTFALLVQFGSFLADVDRGRGTDGRISVYTRRIGEVIVDGALISASFLAAYLLRFDGIGTPNQRHLFLLTLPVLLFCRYVALLLLGMYAGVWRYASSRDALRGATAVGISGVVALGVVVLTQGALGDFSRSVFVIDAFICSIAIAAARFAERAIVRGLELTNRGEGRRVLIIGAGRTGRSMLRELRETPGERVVGFVDDDPALRGRRLNGVQVIADTSAVASALERVHPDVVFVTIPTAPKERLDQIVRACAQSGIDCHFVRREVDIDPQVFLGAERP